MPTGDERDDDKASKWRLAVHERGQAEPICLVWQDATDVRAQGTRPEEIAPVIEALKPVLAELSRERMRWEDDGGSIGAPWLVTATCYAALESAGFEVRPIPTGDLQLRITIDQSGRVVGESTSLHGTLDPELAGDIFNRLQAMPENLAAELAAVVVEAVGRDDHERAAAEALEKAHSIIMLGNSPKLLSTLRLIDVAKLSRESRHTILKLRFGAAASLKTYDVGAARDARLLKEEFWSELDQPAREGLLLLEGCCAADAGQPDTAFAIWRSVLDLPNLSGSGRAWACNNLATLLKPTDPTAAEYAQLASDAFLQQGQRVDAARNSLRRANCILAERPADALRHIDEAIGWFAPDGANGRDLRAGLLHAKANTLLRLGHPADAERLAVEAAELRRGIHGAEEGRCASLHLAAHAAKDAGHSDAAASYQQEADSLAATSDDAAGTLLRRIALLISEFDADTADRLGAEAATMDDPRARGALELVRSFRLDLPLADRISHLEKAEAMLKTAGGRARDMDLVHHALAAQLLAAGFRDRALPHYMTVLEHDPLNHEARQNAGALLFELGKWEDAVRFFAEQLRVFGRKPGILYAYGRSLLESGDPGRAVAFLNDARNAGGADPSLRKFAEEFMNVALQRAGRAAPPSEASRDERPISREELEECLTEFSAFVAGDKRMTFWSADGNGAHKWTSRPEHVAKDLLHTALKMRFRARIEVFEEIPAGAGRIDLYIRCQGGLAVVLELKMLGAPSYSTTYAFSGQDQVVHYMESKGVKLGYLVLFDARRRDFGTGLNPTTTVNASTVRVFFVDVRPEAPSSS